MIDIRMEDAEEDFGTLVIEPGRDDGVTLHASGNGAELRIPLFSHEARALIDVLSKLAEVESLA